MELIAIALVLIGLRFPYIGIATLFLYIAYAKPDLLPIVTLLLIYGAYKLGYKVMKSISKENIIKH